MSPLPLAVIGGGPAGAAFATLAARAGRPVTVFERDRAATDKVCGDFLSGPALDRLRRLGVEPDRLGATPIRRVRFAAGTRVAEAALPFAARGLTRRVLDEALLRQAEAAGATVERGRTIAALARDATGSFTLRFRDGSVRAAARVVLATGKHDLRAWARPGGGAGADYVGFKWYLPAASVSGLDDAVELALFPGGYAGLQRVDGGRATFCLVVRGARFRENNGDPARVVHAALGANRLLADRLGAAVGHGLARPIAVARIPYGFVARHASAPDLLRLGDQAAVIPSLAGDGVALALHAAFRAAVWDGAPDAQRQLAAALAPSVRRAGWIAAVALKPALQQPFVRVLAMAPRLIRIGARVTRVAGAPPRFPAKRRDPPRMK